MMKKEQLEEIKLLVEELTYEYVHDDTFYGLFVDIDRESIDLLIEQAEIGVNADKDKQTLIKSNIELNARVQELEEEIKKIRGAYDERLVDINWYQNMLGIDYEEMSIELPIERVQSEKIKRLEKQNKRYWEFINNVKTAVEQPIGLDELFDVIQREYEALEESK